jgi:phosphatidylinositol kinase/protein kinase (PI-3  family)
VSIEQVIISFLKELRESEYETETESWREDSNIDLEKIDHVLDNIRQSIFEKFDIASKAYFRYLIVHGSLNLQNEKLMRKQGDVITATLRLIRIFAKYGVALHSTFHSGFLDTPLSFWKNVIPQLFSRLYHPETIVCNEITDLLCRITTEYSHLMCYPAILGAQEVKSENDQIIRDAYDKILATLREENTILVSEMEMWMSELRRIAVLWEETWQIGLEHLNSEMSVSLTKIEKDLERISANTSLAELERNEIKRSTVTNLMKPVLFSIEKLCEQTFRLGATTPHEIEFVENYTQMIEKGVCALEEAGEFEEVKLGWKVFQEVLQRLIKFSSMNRGSPLNLAKLSPSLSTLQSTNIFVPGIGLNDEKVAFCSPELRVLPTKTKPKKLELESSTGEKYSFLLKGHEDLHLDERIQQFLQITNSLLYCDKQTRNRSLSARTYNVIPFGNNYGIIQWVENVSGLFSFYRKWQFQEFKIRNASKPGSDTVPQPPRPHEMFQRKVVIACKEGKLDKKEPRQNWPSTVMIEIFNQLKKETPSDIFSNEIWTSSTSSANWWTKTNRFSRSLAVMSIIGYTLGLGDRHMDNILVDLKQGEAVHIDFNVCFEKGKRLRIPEMVPFRLTQNLIRALGPSGVDGHFRTACENVLRVMRENREILLTLLEAFIYDPLVDWTKQEGMEKQILNLNVNIGLLCSRISDF